jgi:hypothetical protein
MIEYRLEKRGLRSLHEQLNMNYIVKQSVIESKKSKTRKEKVKNINQ